MNETDQANTTPAIDAAKNPAPLWFDEYGTPVPCLKPGPCPCADPCQRVMELAKAWMMPTLLAAEPLPEAAQ